MITFQSSNNDAGKTLKASVKRSCQLLRNNYDAGPHVSEHVLIFMGAQKGIKRHWNSAHLYSAKEGVEKFRAILKYQADAFFGLDAEGPKSVAYAVTTLQELFVRDLLFTTLDRYILRSSGVHVLIDEIAGSIQFIGNGEHLFLLRLVSSSERGRAARRDYRTRESQHCGRTFLRAAGSRTAYTEST
jgi:hypothetical protein